MLTRRLVLTRSALGLAASVALPWTIAVARAEEAFAVSHTDDEWHKLLTADQFAVLRKSATERPFTSPLLHEERRGSFACAGCDLDLFASTTKYDSRTGWPSFWAPLEHAVGTSRDSILWHDQDGGALQPLRRPSRPRLQRRSEADRPALLHERHRAYI